jgi:hypothetical protein
VSSVADRHRFDAHPDPTFHFYVDPHPHAGKSDFFLLLKFVHNSDIFTLIHLARQHHKMS